MTGRAMSAGTAETRSGVEMWNDLAFVDRFVAKYETTSGCWLWTGAKVRGRGTISYRDKMILAPRAAKIIADRAWPDSGLQACHSCDNPSCVNPAHIWWGSNAQNGQDAASKGRLHHQKRTHCAKGHPLSGENLRLTKGRRVCRICGADRQNRWRSGQPASAVANGDGPQTTDNRENIVTTSGQQAVPVAQEDWRINPDTPTVILTPNGRIAINWSVQQAGGDVTYDLAEQTAEMIVRAVNSLPCKSGEGADIAVWCAREAEARRAENNSSPHTAKLTREGRYDDQGVMPVAIEAARIALGLSATDATQTREAEGQSFEALERFITDHEGNDETSDGLDVDLRARAAVSALRNVVSAALAVCHSGDDDCTNGRVVTIDPDAFDALNAALDRVGDEGDDDRLTGEEAWDVLVNVDDRTSPEEYPDMCLITRDELIGFMDRAA